MTLTLHSCERVDPTVRVIRAAQRWEAAWSGYTASLTTVSIELRDAVRAMAGSRDDAAECAERIAIEGIRT